MDWLVTLERSGEFYIGIQDGHRLLAEILLGRVNSVLPTMATLLDGVDCEVVLASSPLEHYVYGNIMDHLYAVGRFDDRRALFLQLRWMLSTMRCRGAKALLQDLMKYGFGPGDDELKLLMKSIRLSLPGLTALAQHQETNFNCRCNWWVAWALFLILLIDDLLSCTKREEIVFAYQHGIIPTKFQLRSPEENVDLIISCGSAVSAVCVLLDGRIVSGCHDGGAVQVWDGDMRVCEVLLVGQPWCDDCYVDCGVTRWSHSERFLGHYDACMEFR